MSRTTEVEIRPCPFCAKGDTMVIWQGQAAGFYAFVRCLSCRAEGPRIQSERGEMCHRIEAIVAWNRVGDLSRAGELLPRAKMALFLISNKPIGYPVATIARDVLAQLDGDSDHG